MQMMEVDSKYKVFNIKMHHLQEMMYWMTVNEIAWKFWTHSASQSSHTDTNEAKYDMAYANTFSAFREYWQQELMRPVPCENPCEDLA